MRVSYNWLQDYIDLQLLPDDLARLLTLLGLEVDYVEDLGSDYRDLIIAQVMEVKPHPQAKHLHLVRVHTGEGEYPLVCGADNVEKGQKVVLAPPGSRLPGGSIIEENTLKGERSRGMLCSQEELGLQEGESQGIMVLDDEATVGEGLASYLGLDDQIFVLDLTPNYGHALSMIGVARELAAALGKEVKMPSIPDIRKSGQVEDLLEVEVEDPLLCPRYTARIIEGVQVGPSPWWMQRRLLACGLRPVNNVVDITNYVMLEMGQPLHAFDYDQVMGNKIIVRRAQEGETLRTLDDKERLLHEDDQIIADESGPLALAGVMGGLNSEVTEGTANILLEAAVFHPGTVRQTAKRMILHSPSSHRFERGVDIEKVSRASLRAAQLMATLCDGELIGGLVDAYPDVQGPRRLGLRPQRVNNLLGTDISRKEIKSLLERLHFKVESSRNSRDELKVQVPTFRNDIAMEVDLVEEIARLYGYDRIPVELPSLQVEIGQRKPEQDIEDHTQEHFRSGGFDQALTTPFSNEDGLSLAHKAESRVTLKNPLSDEGRYLRQELLPGLLQALTFNAKRQVQEARLFEINTVYLPSEEGDSVRELSHLAAAIMGESLVEARTPWEKEAPNFFFLKGVLESLCGDLDVELAFSPSEYSFLHPGRQVHIEVGNTVLGWLGELHPREGRKRRLPRHTTVMELNFAQFVRAATLEPVYEGVPRYPASDRDLALLVDEDIPARKVLDLLRGAAGPHAESVQIFDLYRGPQIPEGKKSLAFTLVFRNHKRTLKDDEVDGYIQEILKRAESELGAELRR